MAEVAEAVQQTIGYWPEPYQGTENATVDNSPPSNENPTIDSPRDSSKRSSHSDNNEDSGSSSESLTRYFGHTYEKDETSHVESSEIAGEVVEEEIVELEFEKVKPKLDMHSMHCPNCKSEITKVILRRKVITSRRPEPAVAQPVVEEPQKPDDPQDLVGCLSCLSLFTFSGNGSFNPFDIFRKKTESTPQTTVEGTTTGVTENENCFSMFFTFKKKQTVTETVVPSQTDSAYVDRDNTVPGQPTVPRYVIGNASIAQGQPPSSLEPEDDQVTPVVFDNEKAKKKGSLGGTHRTPSTDQLPPSSNPPIDDDTTIVIDPEHENEVLIDAPVTGRPWFGYEGILAEILKSIVYGGLLEAIASLSIVASAAASETATLNIIALSLASLVGGIIILWNNIWDLRNDCYKENPSQQTEEGEGINKYKEQFGRVNFFPLHTIIAILSFIVFGMIPPVTYGFTFNKTNDRDYTMAAVAIASLLGVALLALLKAFINECGVLEYFKTVSYYITTAVTASGLSYVAGNLVTRFVTELGWFDASSGGGLSLLPHATNPSLASF